MGNGGNGGEEDFGEFVGRLFDDTKAYAAAEFDLARIKVEEKALAYRASAILVAVAAVLGLAAVITLFVTITLALATLIGPLAGGLVATLLAAGGAAAALLIARTKLEPRP